MFTVSICIECLHRIRGANCSEQNDRGVSVLSRYVRKEVSKK